MSSRQRNLEQIRAKQAWGGVREAKAQGGDTTKDYGTLARDLPSLLHTNGLGQTLAFLQSKKDGHRLLLQHVSAWVMGQMGVQDMDLLDWVISIADGQEYRRATAEAMAFAEWLKRFAESELPSDGRNGDSHGN